MRRWTRQELIEQRRKSYLNNGIVKNVVENARCSVALEWGQHSFLHPTKFDEWWMKGRIQMWESCWDPMISEYCFFRTHTWHVEQSFQIPCLPISTLPPFFPLSYIYSHLNLCLPIQIFSQPQPCPFNDYASRVGLRVIIAHLPRARGHLLSLLCNHTGTTSLDVSSWLLIGIWYETSSRVALNGHLISPWENARSFCITRFVEVNKDSLALFSFMDSPVFDW